MDKSEEGGDHSRFAVLLGGELSELRRTLCQHPIYERLHDLESWRVFMDIHVFAVWDFMVLLKSLQGRLTGSAPLWVPPADRLAARMINEIVLSEESDEVRPGVYMSHQELYREAMREAGAEGAAFEVFSEWVAGGSSVEAALSGARTVDCVRHFVRTTTRMATAPVHRSAAAFLFGREEIIPDMFTVLLREMDRAGLPSPSLRLYLDRHRELDGGDHQRMGRALLTSLCGDDDVRWEEAREAALISLRARARLWDGALDQLETQLDTADS